MAQLVQELEKTRQCEFRSLKFIKKPDLEGLIYNPSVIKKIEVMTEELPRSFRVVVEIKDILPQKLSSDLHFVEYMNMYSYLQPSHKHTYIWRGQNCQEGGTTVFEKIYIKKTYNPSPRGIQCPLLAYVDTKYTRHRDTRSDKTYIPIK